MYLYCQTQDSLELLIQKCWLAVGPAMTVHQEYPPWVLWTPGNPLNMPLLQPTIDYHYYHPVINEVIIKLNGHGIYCTGSNCICTSNNIVTFTTQYLKIYELL